jgi:rfaE bifunctional protein kinase chain/domain
MTAARRYRDLINGFERVRAAVAGDLIADEFIYGQIERVSREAPVLILGYDSAEVLPGGAGNAARNAASLGAAVDVVGVVGRDPAGDRLFTALQASVGVSGVVRASNVTTPVKTRILAGGVHSAKQQVVRIDRAGGPVTPAAARRVERALVKALQRTDVLVVSDYGSGLVTPELWQRAVAAVKGQMPRFVLVDSRYALGQFSGMTACTPNESEVEALLGVRIDDNRRILEEAGRELLHRLRCQAVLITRGSRGMALFEPDRPTDHIPIVGSDQVTDVTGAGDTVIATFAVALASGATFGEAARLANHAGGIVVMKRGTAVVTRRELLAAMTGTSSSTPRPTAAAQPEPAAPSGRKR